MMRFYFQSVIQEGEISQDAVSGKALEKIRKYNGCFQNQKIFSKAY